MRFTEKGKVFEYLEYNEFFKDKIFKLLEIEEGRGDYYQIVYQFLGEFGETVTATFEINKALIDVLLKNLETENNKSKFIKRN